MGTALVMAFQNYFTGMFAGGRGRKYAFKQNDFIQRNFEEEHNKAFPKDSDHQPALSPMGFPDTGSGNFADKLSYKKWFTLNCMARAHGNGMEYVT